MNGDSALVVLLVALVAAAGSVGSAWVAVRAQRSTARAQAVVDGKALGLEEVRFLVDAHREEIERLDGENDELRVRVGALETSLRHERARCDGLERELARLRGGL